QGTLRRVTGLQGSQQTSGPRSWQASEGQSAAPNAAGSEIRGSPCERNTRWNHLQETTRRRGQGDRDHGHPGSSAEFRPLITPLISFRPYRRWVPFVTAVTM